MKFKQKSKQQIMNAQTKIVAMRKETQGYAVFYTSKG